MTNQAAQTMPELPKAWGFARNVDGQIEIRIGPVCPPNRSGGLATPWAPMFGGDQMHQYAREYAAALSQNAGVVVKWEVRRRFWIGAPWGPWESYETEAERTESFAKFEGSEWLHETRELYASAPAASGGEDGWQRMTAEARSIQMRHLDDHHGDVYHAMQSLVVKHGYRSTGPMTQPIATAPSAASVSEVARGYRQHDAIEFAVRDLGYSPAEAARITATIEQALTQQRWDGEAVDRDAWAEALASASGVDTSTNEAWAARAQEKIAAMDAASGGEAKPAFGKELPSSDEEAMYAAAGKGFHTSETSGTDGRYVHVIRFRSIEELHAYEHAWTAAMVKVRDSRD